ncbi:MAG: hypothetical protein P4L65_10990 [Legionella sp.]|nr:hypothetical protein [Legionella sp.]
MRLWEKEYNEHLVDSADAPQTLDVMEQLFRPTASLNMFGAITLRDVISAEIARKCNQLTNGNTVESTADMKFFLTNKLGELARSKDAPSSISNKENPNAELARRILCSLTQVDRCFAALKASQTIRLIQ